MAISEHKGTWFGDESSPAYNVGKLTFRVITSHALAKELLLLPDLPVATESERLAGAPLLTMRNEGGKIVLSSWHIVGGTGPAAKSSGSEPDSNFVTGP